MKALNYKIFYSTLQLILSALFFIGSAVLFIYHGIWNYSNIISSLLFLGLMISAMSIFYVSVKDFMNTTKRKAS